ncbi:MAG: flavocytochrome c [Oscillospiraceae bacterium]|nr:flavocytochrome c [Oscillospiraceae bacterium]
MDKQEKKKRRERWSDIVGISCGIILLIFLVVNIIQSHTVKTVGDTNISAEAMTLTGTSMGRNGPVEVEVVADANRIYQIRVLNHEETEGIGSVAVEKIPVSVYDNQSIEVDAVAGATLTSEAVKAAIADALESGGLNPDSFRREVAAAAPVEKTPMELDCDVVVVGAGGAGLTASVLATQEGKNVILLEKIPFVGGNSLRAEGGMNAAGTNLEKELGLDDSTVENFTEDTLRLGHYLANPELVRTLAENSSDAIEWLKTVDATFTGVKATGGCEGRKYLHQPEGGVAVGEYLVAKLKTQVEKLGIDVHVSTKATEILMENGQAVGVMAEDAEHIYTIHAKAVVLATGGFGANFDLMSSYDPSLANAVTTNHSGATGDGIFMAQAVGADTVDMEQIQLHPTVIQSDGSLVSESFRSLGAIVVNTEGKRFVNDLAGRDVVSQAELKQPDGYCFIIFDQNLVDHLALSQRFIDGGYTIQGGTYEELGKNMGLSDEAVKNFVNTMNTWNESVAKGIDEEWGRNNGMDDDLSTAPFYAIKIAPGIHHTMGGIKINTNAEVIDTSGNVIPGLFACGETTGGIHGGNRVGGNAVCDFIVFGRIAGKSASDFAEALS